MPIRHRGIPLSKRKNSRRLNPLHNYLAGRIDPMQLENILGQINAKRDDRRF